MSNLSPEEYAALKADIQEHGVQIPVIYDEQGHILDGHHRVAICRELGISDFPKTTVSSLSADEKQAYARKINMIRRHLSREQKRKIIGHQLPQTPEISDRKLGAMLGVDGKTVGTVRKELETTEEIPQLTHTVGADGRERSRHGNRTNQPSETAESNRQPSDSAATGQPVKGAVTPQATEGDIEEQLSHNLSYPPAGLVAGSAVCGSDFRASGSIWDECAIYSRGDGSGVGFHRSPAPSDSLPEPARASRKDCHMGVENRVERCSNRPSGSVLRGRRQTMNRAERALMHALFVHLHHNIDKAIDFGAFKELNDRVGQLWPDTLMVGPEANDDAAVFRVPETDVIMVAKMESHCSPCVPRPYDGAATGAGGAMRDVVAMGGRPLFLLDFIGTRPLDQEVIVGPCGFDAKCTCGQCQRMTSGERVDLLVQGIRDMCEAMGVFVVGGGLSTSFSDIVPAVVVAVVGRLVTDEPLTKPAKEPGNKIIVLGETADDGNDTLYRAGLVDEMRPARALFRQERQVMDAALSVMKTGKVRACSDLGAAGIGAAVSESVRFGGLGARVDLSLVPTSVEGLSPEEVLICETQGRMLFQVAPGDVPHLMEVLSSHPVKASVIGEITSEEGAQFTYGDDMVARIPNRPDPEVIESLRE